MRYALLGDSQGEGLAPHLRRLLGEQLVHVKVQHGISTQRALEDGFFTIPSVDVVIVALGGNDNGSDSQAIATRTAYQQLRSRANRVVWVGPAHAARPDVDARHLRSEAVQRRIIPTSEWLSGRAFTRDLEHRNDNVHFTSESYGRWARAILRVVQSGPMSLVIGASGVVGASVAAALIIKAVR